jgi:hypothetical protein
MRIGILRGGSGGHHGRLHLDDARSARRLRPAREEIGSRQAKLGAMTEIQKRLTDYADCAG